jgi:hypothetical protein
MDARMDGQMDGGMDGWTDGWVGGWTRVGTPSWRLKGGAESIHIQCSRACPP